MPNEEYLKAKEKKNKERKNSSMLVFTLVVIALVGGIVFIVRTIAN